MLGHTRTRGAVAVADPVERDRRWRRSPRPACRSASCPTPPGQIEAVLRRSGVCQVGPGDGVEVRCVVDSHVVGVAKPDPAIFGHAAVHFPGIAPDRIAYVGDSVTMDVGGARAAGLHPILVDPYDDHPDADFDRITSLDDLL